MANHISRQIASLDLQAKEGMYDIKYRDISETAFIKSDIQITMDMVKNNDQYQRIPM